MQCGHRLERVGLALFAAFAACTAACASPGAAADEDACSTSQAIVGGSPSDSTQDAVVLVIHHDPGAASDDVCSGTLLTPTLVLTARHCVAPADPSAACSSDGTAVSGGRVYKDYDPSTLYVFAGAERPWPSSADATWQRGRAIIDDGSETLCNHDIALILLSAPVPGARTAPVRLDTKSQPGEPITLVGWGLSDASSRVPTTRQQRAGEAILTVGPSRRDGLGAGELLVGEAACAGDSGGPALSARGGIIGVLSRGVTTKTKGQVESCIGTTNVYTTTASFGDLILAAYAQAGHAPWLESEGAPESAAPASDQGGCATSGRRDGSPLALEAAIALGWMVVRPRTRPSRGGRSLARETSWPQRRPPRDGRS